MRPLALLPVTIALAGAAFAAFVATAQPKIILYETGDCTPDENWVSGLQAEGFDVRRELVADTNGLQDTLRVPTDLRDCRVAQVAGYSLIGTIPASDTINLLRKKPGDVIALALDPDGQGIVALHHDGSVERNPAQSQQP
ncbi:MAG: hypothetical protein ABID63_07815 [Pseudomonadota bacterium]